MKKIIYLTGLVIFFSTISAYQAHSQGILKKIKQKAEDAVIEKVFEEEDDSNAGNQDDPGTSGSASNTRGGGLNRAPVDVMELIGDAQTAFNGKKYKDARYSIRQAILEIELEIGENILDGLPDKIAGLSKVDSEDNVTSTGIGFVGLIVERVYRGGDQEFRVNVGNDAGWLSMANMYLASGVYASSSEEQNYKQTTFKDYRAVIEYDENTGYKLSVPFGQSSILVTEGVNFSTEDEFMNASLNIDIETIKTQLGEQ